MGEAFFPKCLFSALGSKLTASASPDFLEALGIETSLMMMMMMMTMRTKTMTVMIKPSQQDVLSLCYLAHYLYCKGQAHQSRSATMPRLILHFL